jgi:hypothetical protein
VLKALERIEAALARSEERAAKAEKRVEELEKTVKSLLTQLKPTVTQPGSTPASPPSPSLAPLRAEAPAYRLPGINLDLSAAPQLHDKNPSELRKLVDERLKLCGLDIKSLGISVKDKHKVRVYFRGSDHPVAQREASKWTRAMVEGPGHVRVYGEQWFPIRVDAVRKDVTTDELGRTLMGKLNNVCVTKMRWLSGPTVGKLHGSMVVFLEEKEQADRLLGGAVVQMPGGEVAFPRVFETKVVPTRCYRCHEYGHLQLRCSNEVVCGHCAAKGHQAEAYTSPITKCAGCQGPHRATDPGCPQFKKERRKLQSCLQ